MSFQRIIGFLLFLTCPLFAANRIIVDSIEIWGNRTVDAAYIKTVAAITPGRPIDAEEIRAAIKRLWETELFNDVQIKTTAIANDHAVLVICVQENKKLETVEIIGNKALTTAKINALLNLYPGKTITPTRIIHTRNLLLDKYRQLGFPFSRVQIFTENGVSDSSRIRMIVVIEEKTKSTLSEIRFHGNYHFSNSRLAKLLTNTKPKRWWRKEKFDEKNWHKELERIVDYYTDHGYRDAFIQNHRIEHTAGQTKTILHVDLHEGPIYQIGDMSVTGNVNMATTELLAAIDLKRGERYNRSKIDRAIQETISGLYYERGYIYCHCTPQEIEQPGHIIDVCFQITEGKPALVQNLAIAGNSKTQEKIIRRELLLAPGDTFRSTLLERSQRELYMLNYFSEIEPRVIPKSESLVDVEIKVKEKDTRLLQFAAGWSEVDKLLGSLSYSMNNFRGRGQQTRVMAELGKSYQSCEFGFLEPYFYNHKFALGFAADYMDRKAFAAQSHDRLHPFSEHSFGFSMQAGKKLDWPDHYTSAQWVYHWQQQQFGDFDEGFVSRYPLYQNYVDRTFHISSITQTLSHNTLDRPQFPSTGSSVSLTSTLAGVLFGGNVHFHKHHLEFDCFKPIHRKLVFHAGCQTGFLYGIGSHANIPISEYYTIGGDGLSRSIPLCGYPDPLTENGYSYSNGSSLFKVGGDLRFAVLADPEIYLLAFAEVGNVWRQATDMSLLRVKRAAGFGLRFNLPLVGIVGLNYGYAFDRKNDQGLPNPHWGFQFILGKSY